MSHSIRSYIHDVIDANVTDDALERIRRLLMAAPGKHSIPMTIKVAFEVDDDGNSKMVANVATNMKIPAWDTPINIKSQLTLFDLSGVVVDQGDMTVTSDRPTTPVETISPPQLNGEVERTIPEEDLQAPGIALGGMPAPAATTAEAATSQTAEQRMEAINRSNAESLARVADGDAKLTPEAQAALKAMSGS